MSDLRDLAAEIVERLRANFPDADLAVQQVLCLAEEAGEAQEAYLLSSRGGPWSDVEAELADVIITAYVSAVVLGIDLWAVRPLDTPLLDGRQQVLDVGAKAGGFVGAYRRWSGMARRSGSWADVVAALTAVVAAVRAAADVLEIDLDAAVEAKSAVILSRGWRDRPDRNVRPSAGRRSDEGEWPGGR